MIPAILGLGGLTAKIIASAVIPRVVRAISSSFSTTKANEPCPPPAVEGISSVSDTPPVPPGSGVFVPRESLRKFAWAGLWNHKASGLYLATFRAFDPVNKRWISRDPLGEGVDYNLYRYCGNDPIGCQDSLGLKKAKLRTLEFDVRSPIKTCFLKITVDVYYDDDTGIVSFENGQVSGKLPVQGNLAIGIDTSFRTKTQEWEGGDQESTVSSFDKNKPFSHNLEGIYPVRGPGANGGQVDIKVDFKMNLTYISPKGVSTKSDSNTTGWFGIGLGTDFQPVPVAPHFGRDGSGGIPGITR